MGGAAFASGHNALRTPRMAPAVYTSVRGRCHAILFTLFSVVATPIEGPGKANFGDVDILVALPRGGAQASDDPDGEHLLQEAMARLGAVRSATQKGKASMAIPWPADLLSLAPTPTDPEDNSGVPPHIQVDLALAPSLPLLHWALFKHAHGDFWNIVGVSVLRPLGLTVDERALWLRVPEIEAKNHKRARVFLANEPADVLLFLGLRILDDHDDRKSGEGGIVSLWEQPFPTAEALFECVTNSRFFHLPDLGSNGHIDDNTDPNAPGLKSNDRRRLRQRPLFRRWATEYVPALYASGHHLPTSFYSDAVPTRDTVRDAAFAFFPGSQARFESTRTSFLREKHLLAIRSAVKAAVPETLPMAHRGGVCAAARLHLGLTMSGAEGTLGSTAAAEEAAAAWTVDSVTGYIQKHWLAITAEAAPLTYTKYLADNRSE